MAKTKTTRALSLAVVTTAAFVATATVFGSTAMAQEESYGYEFDDDPLNAGGFGPNDATIRVRPGAARTLLIRPRTQFVEEMLQSVENL